MGHLEQIDSGLRDAGELFTLAKGEGDDATLAAIEADTGALGKVVEDLEFRRMFSTRWTRATAS